MNSKKISSNRLMAQLIGVTFCFTASVALAGPLDRGETQSRQNPAANSMIRIPGVLGQSEQYALETLQRAGLNVNTKYIRKSRKKYASRNGKVVKQIPSAGGIAMLGSSVTITIYKVKGEPMDDSGGGGYGSGGSDGGSYGGGGYGSGGSGGGSYGGGGYGSGGSGGGSYGGDGYGSGGSGGGSYGGDDTGGSGYGDPSGGAGGYAPDSNPADDGYGGAGGDSGADEAAPPEDGSPGPDWSSPGSDSGGDGSAPYGTGP